MDQYIAEEIIEEYLIRAKVPSPNSHSKRDIKGLTKCKKPFQGVRGTIQPG